MTWQTVGTVQYFDGCQKRHSDLEAYQDLKFRSESTVHVCLKCRCIWYYCKTENLLFFSFDRMTLRILLLLCCK